MLSEKTLILPTMAAAYAIGIVLDRLAWSLFGRLERHIQAKHLLLPGVPHWKMEKFVMDGSEHLAEDLHYTRSRLRICRAWILNALLITVLFLVWGQTQGRLNATQTLAAGVAGAASVGGLFWALRRFMIDYCRNLRRSYKFLKAADAAGRSPIEGE